MEGINCSAGQEIGAMTGLDKPEHVPAQMMANVLSILGVTPLSWWSFMLGDDQSDGAETGTHIWILA